jgi:hypothetical protein
MAFQFEASGLLHLTAFNLGQGHWPDSLHVEIKPSAPVRKACILTLLKPICCNHLRSFFPLSRRARRLQRGLATPSRYLDMCRP